MTLRTRLLRLLWAGPMALGVCYFALWACAPLFSAPSPAPIPLGRTNQLGVAGGYAAVLDSPRAAGCNDLISGQCSGLNFQAYYRRRFQKVELIVLAHGGQISLVGGGALVRGFFVETGGFRMGLSGGLGPVFAQVGLPVAGKLAPSLWLYTEPTGAVSMVGMARLPVGLSWSPGAATFELEGGLAASPNFWPPYGYGSLSVGYAF